MLKKLFSTDSIFAFVSILVILGLSLLPTGFPTNEYPNSARAKVKIISVDNAGMSSPGGVVLIGTQQCLVKVMNGPFKGQELTAKNHMMGKLEVDKIFKEGDTALSVLDYQDGKLTHITLIDHYRLNLELYLFAAFILLLVLFAGWTGVKALISFIITVLTIWKVLIPSFLKGINPIVISMCIVIFLTCMIILLVGGLNRKSIVAILGSALGTTLTCILAVIFGSVSRIHGAVLPYSETLLYAGYAHLNLTDILIAGTFIASSGAMMDVAIDISAAIHEMVLNNPNTTTRQAVNSGFSIGRAVIGTMTTTLLLAYSGGYVALLMVFMAQGTPVVNILNLRYVSAEILHTMVGSFGLVAVAPFTAVMAGVLFTRRTYIERIGKKHENCTAASF